MSTMTAFLTRYASLIFLNYDSLNKQILTMYRAAREKMFNWSMQTGWCLIILLKNKGKAGLVAQAVLLNAH